MPGKSWSRVSEGGVGLVGGGLSYRGRIWALVFGRLRRGTAWSVPGAADPALTQPAPCRALPHIPAAMETQALLWPGSVPSAEWMELMAG